MPHSGHQVGCARYVTPQPYNTIALAAGQLATAAVLSVALLPLDGGTVHPTDRYRRRRSADPGHRRNRPGLRPAWPTSSTTPSLTAEGPTAASLVAYLIPVVAVILGVLILGDQLPPLAGLGALLVLGGVALVRRKPRAQQAS